MIDVSKISPEIIESLISGMGWEKNEDKAPYLAQLATMDVSAALGKWAQWEIGDSGWARVFLRVQTELTAAQQEVMA